MTDEKLCEKHNVPYIHGTWGLICPKCREENALQKTEESIEKSHQEISMETTIKESVNRDFWWLKEKGRITDYQIESIDMSDLKEPKVVVTMVLNKPIGNIKEKG